ncbi:serine/threonine-protein phosphatase 7 long form-like protein, partial [Trifolium medium]|nr:serine/threonine-protein phosphatase 7 long form-like protein [Trifolium medium]
MLFTFQKANKGDKDKRPTKVTTSARRKNAAENPPKKRAHKGTSAPETAHVVPEHHEGETAQADDMPEGRHYEGEQAHDMAEGRSGNDGDDIIREIEAEELEREGDQGPYKVRCPAWVNPYEGKLEPGVFPGGPSDKTVLYDYGAPHIARCVYDEHDRDLISDVSNGGKIFNLVVDVSKLKWWEPAIKATGMHGLDRTGYAFIDLCLLATFVERWHGETISFHMSSGEMTVTLDD